MKKTKLFYKLKQSIKRLKSSYTNHKKKTLGIVITDYLPNLSVNTLSLPLPLTIPTLSTRDIEINITGGIKIPADGKYLVTFSANVITGAPGDITLYGGSNFLGTSSLSLGSSLINLAIIRTLSKGDVIQAVASGEVSPDVIGQGILTAVKLRHY